KPRPAARSRLELREADGRLRELVGREVPRLPRGLLRDERMDLEARRDLARAHALVRECRDLADAADVADERGDDPRELARPRPVRPLEQRLGGAERRRDVPASPRVGDGEDRRLGAADGELLDDRARDLLAVRPRRELLDLGGERADLVPDRLDESAARVAVGGGAEPG